MNLRDIELPQGGMPESDLLTAGQPSAAQFEALAAAGLKHVINLRPPSEDAGFDEPAAVSALGLGYTVVPVASGEDLCLARVRELDAALAAANGAPTLVHCASSNRVGALLALRAAWLQDQSADEALAIGRAGGLTKMEGAVAQLIARGPA